MRQRSPQEHIAAACEDDLILHGSDSVQGVGYKSSEEAAERFEIMLGVVRAEDEGDAAILDLGCGLAHMLDHIRACPRYQRIRYTGLDISERYIEAARARHPDAELILMDLLEPGAHLPQQYDYVVMNGLFNFRGGISHASMLDYWRRLTSAAWAHCRRGVAFNAMSKIVDWERDDLFHLSFDAMGEFVSANLSRHFLIRHDYPAYEYTTYVYRAPSQA